MKICAIPAGTGGVAFYRMKQPFRKLIEDGEDIFIYDPDKHDANRLYQQQNYADIVIYQCPWSEGILEAVKLIKSGEAFGKKKKVIIEMDDNLFSVDEWNEKYNVFGLEDKYIHVKKDEPETQKKFIQSAKSNPWIRTWKQDDGSMTFDMWRDGYANFSIEENTKKHKAVKELLNICDLVTVTTPELGKQLRKYAPKTKMAVLPNYIDTDRWLPMKENDTDEIRIGWQGGSAHFDDIRCALDAMIDIHKKYNSGKKKKVRFCFMGIQYDGIFSHFGDQVEYFPWHGDIETYPLIVRSMKIDIGLAPLKDTVFNRGKSPLKWVEYSMLEIPTIASNVVYDNYIDYGKTGYIAKNRKEWFECMSKLIDSKEKRREIAKKAKERVERKYTQASCILWRSALKDLMTSG